MSPSGVCEADGDRRVATGLASQARELASGWLPHCESVVISSREKGLVNGRLEGTYSGKP